MKKRILKCRNVVNAVLACLCVALIFGISFGSNSMNSFAAANSSKKFFTDYSSREETFEEANKLNERIAEEGFILLKNENNILPLNKAKRISVFGKNSVNPVYGGSGSGGGSTAGAATIYSSLRDVGYELNPILESFYNSSKSGIGRPANPRMGEIPAGIDVGEAPISSYTDLIRSSYDRFSDAAIVVISRIGGEGFDLPRTSMTCFPGEKDAKGNPLTPAKINGAKSMDSHYLELTKNEADMLTEVSGHFDDVVVIVNSSTSMELGFLQAGNEDYHEQIQGALWIGGPGTSGMNALGRILKGEVNPSGRTVDIFARDFKQNSTWFNFANNNSLNGNRYRLADGKLLENYEIRYDEGIYMGYRYYETRGYEEANANVPNANWYDEHVVFPFGYGLSYTTFEWEIQSQSPAAAATLRAKDNITVNVKVSNTGNVAGRDVVELYYSAPYIKGEVEKSSVVLGDFAKTNILQPGESQIVTLTIKAQDMASYDFDDKNSNNHKGYELDAGAYKIQIMKDSHNIKDNLVINYTVSEDIKYDTDSFTDKPVANHFDDISNFIKNKGMVSRADFAGTMPTAFPSDADLVKTLEQVAVLENPVIDAAFDAGKPWAATTKPTQAATELTADQAKIKLSSLIGVDYTTPDGRVKWDAFMNQFTVEQLAFMIGNVGFETGAIPALGIPKTSDPDGPSKIGTGNCTYASECVVAATWSKEVAYEMGRMMGNEALWSGISGWYAPAMNTHRTPFAGRNFEYYSEDGVLGGNIGAMVVKGARSKGIFSFIKHFALNDQETNRNTLGLVSYATEQSMREIYFKQFELTVKVGGSLGVMSSNNRVGTVWSSANYPLLTELLRNEWGFKGVAITDMQRFTYMLTDQMIRAGNDLSLGSKRPTTTPEALTPTHLTAMRNAAMHICYAVANSNGMLNGIGDYESKELALAKVGANYNGSLAAGAKFGAEWVNYVLKSDSVLPEGMSIVKNTGMLTGAPKESGSFKFTVVAYGDGWVAKEADYVLNVDSVFYNGDASIKAEINKPLSIDSKVVSEMGNPINGTYVGSQAAGRGTPAWDGNIPEWLTLDSATGILTGTPTVEGVYEFSVRAKPTGYGFIDVPFTVTVGKAGAILHDKLTYSGSMLQFGKAGAEYSQSVATATGSSAITYTLKENSALPTGLKLNANGTITGKLSDKVGASTFTVIASADGLDSVEATFTINVNEATSSSGCGASAITDNSIMLGIIAILVAGLGISIILKRSKNNNI